LRLRVTAAEQKAAHRRLLVHRRRLKWATACQPQLEPEAGAIMAPAASEAADAASIADEAASMALDAASEAAIAAGSDAAAEAASGAASSAFLPQAARAIAATREANKSDFFMNVLESSESNDDR
jgi:hypothetical protein